MLRKLGFLPVVLLVAGALAWAASPAGAEHPDRVAGPNRYATAAQVSASHFDPGVPVVHVVTGTRFPDALAAGVAAGVAGGPVLLSEPGRLPAVTVTELDRLEPERIVVVGGSGSVSDAVVRELERHTAGTVTRIDGPDRFATAAAVAAAAFPDGAQTVFVANGTTFPDALAGVPAAVREGAPLLLVTRGTVPAPTSQAVTALGARHVVVLGGPGSVDAAVEARLRDLAGSSVRAHGADRYATSVAAAQRAFPGGAGVAYLATGASAADALAAGPVAALEGGPVLLVRGNCIPPAVLDELHRLGSPRTVLLGGDRAVGTAVGDRARCPSAHNVPGAPALDARPTAPAWDQDAPDPHVLRVGHRYYAYTTGTTWGNRLGVLVSDRPDGGWRTITGQPWGSTALPSPPAWQRPDTQWAPAVYRFGGRYVLFYAAQRAATGEWCLSVATSPSPEGPFADQTGDTGPIVCQDHLGGTIDPHPFVDADGRPWLHFKNNDGIPGPGDDHAVSRVWATRLDGSGVWPVGPHHEVMAKDTTRYAWQTTLDNPQMVLRGGVHYLFHTGGDYVGNDTYATGYATCAGPVGPCTTHPEPLMTSYGDVAGPGGGTVVRDHSGQWWISYHAWTRGCYDYGTACDGARKLYVAPFRF